VFWSCTVEGGLRDVKIKEGDLRFGGGWLGGPVVYCSC